MKNLFIVWNTYSLMEFLAVEKNHKEFSILIDTDYNKNPTEIRNIINKCIENNLFKNLIEEKDVLNQKFTKVYLMSYLKPWNVNILKNIKFRELILLEEGFYDYLRTDINEEYKYLAKKATLYINKKEDLLNINLFKEIKPIGNKNNEIFNQIMNIKELENYKNIDLIIFTSPINKDYNYKQYINKTIKYLEENYEGKNILIKNHPRDFADYSSNKYNVIYCNKNIPGQIIEQYFTVKKLYTHPSTVLLSSTNLDATTILKFADIKEIKYNNLFNYKIIKKCKIITI